MMTGKDRNEACQISYTSVGSVLQVIAEKKILSLRF